MSRHTEEFRFDLTQWFSHVIKNLGNNQQRVTHQPRPNGAPNKVDGGAKGCRLEEQSLLT